MSGKVLKIASNDLYGNVDDRMVRVRRDPDDDEDTKGKKEYTKAKIDEDIKPILK